MKRDKPKTLADMLDGRFAEGYEQFQKFYTETENTDALCPHDKAFIYLFRLVTTAMIEGLNRGEERFGLDPATLLHLLWSATGISLAGVNTQAFEPKSYGTIRREMRETLMDAYRRTSDKLAQDNAEAHPA